MGLTAWKDEWIVMTYHESKTREKRDCNLVICAVDTRLSEIVYTCVLGWILSVDARDKLEVVSIIRRDGGKKRTWILILRRTAVRAWWASCFTFFHFGVSFSTPAGSPHRRRLIMSWMSYGMVVSDHDAHNDTATLTRRWFKGTTPLYMASLEEKITP